ncbi:kielin/chordin-like protein, partial [Biomphalaria glabrata]
PNCYIDDVIVPMGQEYVRSDGSVCFCQQNEPWQQADVICMPPFKTPAGCESQEKPWDSPCVTCDCVDWSGAGNADWVCWMTDCFPAPCVDKVSVPNECCETCPNGPNCETFGEIIPLGVNKTINGLECHCEYTFILEAPTAVCNPILTTTLETITASPISSTTKERTTLTPILTTTSEKITPSPISSSTQERTTLRLILTTTSETITPSPISSTTKERTTLKQSSTTTSEKTTPNKNRKRISANSNES